MPGSLPAGRGLPHPEGPLLPARPGPRPPTSSPRCAWPPSLVQLDGVVGQRGPAASWAASSATTGDAGGGGGPRGRQPARRQRGGPVRGDLRRRWPCASPTGASVRTVDPYRLDFARGRWYLSGFDHGRQRGAGVPPRPLRVPTPRPCPTPPSSGRRRRGPACSSTRGSSGDGEPVEARVAVDAAQAPWIVQHLGPGAVAEERPDGSVVVTMTVTNRDNFRSFVLDVPRPRRGAGAGRAARRDRRVAAGAGGVTGRGDARPDAHVRVRPGRRGCWPWCRGSPRRTARRSTRSAPGSRVTRRPSWPTTSSARSTWACRRTPPTRSSR